METKKMANMILKEASALGMPISRYLDLLDVNYRTFYNWLREINSPSIERVAKITQKMKKIRKDY
ncbi:MAG: hypothetical protein HRU19_29965 [Pseudobacteriovorax sp.]|nr:hypothetical protein [Pseudobacteriovorax sp.]